MEKGFKEKCEMIKKQKLLLRKTMKQVSTKTASTQCDLQPLIVEKEKIVEVKKEIRVPYEVIREVTKTVEVPVYKEKLVEVIVEKEVPVVKTNVRTETVVVEKPMVETKIRVIENEV